MASQLSIASMAKTTSMGKKINLNERSNLMYLEEEGEEINPKKYLKVVGIDWVIKRKK